MLRKRRLRQTTLDVANGIFNIGPMAILLQQIMKSDVDAKRWCSLFRCFSSAHRYQSSCRKRRYLSHKILVNPRRVNVLRAMPTFSGHTLGSISGQFGRVVSMGVSRHGVYLRLVAASL